MTGYTLFRDSAEYRETQRHRLLLDEASCRPDYHNGTTWHTRGMTPVVEATGSRFGQNLIAAISSKGHMCYMTMEHFNADVFIKFLKQIVRSHDRPVIIVINGHRAHHSKNGQSLCKFRAEIAGYSDTSSLITRVESCRTCLESAEVGSD